MILYNVNTLTHDIQPNVNVLFLYANFAIFDLFHLHKNNEPINDFYKKRSQKQEKEMSDRLRRKFFKPSFIKSILLSGHGRTDVPPFSKKL